MSLILKDDWKPNGNNKVAVKMADWMNTVAKLINGANIPSGGTVQSTPTGLQIEVDDVQDLYPFDVRVVDTDVQVYLPDTTPAVQLYTVDGYELSRLTTDLIVSGTTHWYIADNITLPTDGNYIDLYAITVKSSPTMSADISTESKFTIVSTVPGSPPPLWYHNPIALSRITNNGGSYIIDYHRRGVIHSEPCYTDALQNLITGVNDTYERRSIGKRSDTSGHLELYGFESGNEVAVTLSNLMTSDLDFRFVIRYTNTNERNQVDIGYLNATQFTTIVEDIIDDYITHPNLPPDGLQWENSGHFASTGNEGKLAGFDGDGFATYYDGDGIGSLVNHSALADVVTQTVGDDHRGGRVASGAAYDGGHPYIHCGGNATRNAMDGVIGDSSEVVSIAPDARKLYADAAGVPVETVDYNDCELRDKSGVLSVDWWTSRALFDSVGSASLIWGEYKLNDSGGITTLNWDTRTLNWGWTSSASFDVDISANYKHGGVDGWSGKFEVLQGGVTKECTVSGGIITDVS